SRSSSFDNILQDLQQQLKNVVSNAQQQVAEDALRNRTNRSAKSDISGQNSKQNLNEIKPLNAHSPIFHSTAKAYCSNASTATRAFLPRFYPTGAPQHPNVCSPAATLNPRATYPTTGVAPCGTWYNSDTVRPRTKNLGKTVRELRRPRSENRRLDNIPDEELLDSMVPMSEKPTLFWYRTLRSSWQTYQDFKRAALNNYSITKRNNRSLMVEAHLCTQGADKPVRDYIVSLLTVLSRFDQPWDPQDQVNLVIDNMLPKLKKKMKIYRGRLTNTQELLDKAQEAEDDEDGQWRSPPPAEQSILPETAYRPANKFAKARPASVASLDAKLSSLTEEDLKKHFEKFFQKKTQELNSPSRNTGNATETRNGRLPLSLIKIETNQDSRIFNTKSVTGVAQTLHGTASDSRLATSSSTDVEASCDGGTVASALVEKYPRWWLAVEVGQYTIR
ncbi:hypothetical protein TSAR_014872, partial [Trichomalopsis sarcophagae]